MFLLTGAVRNEVRPIRETSRKSTWHRSESVFRATHANTLDVCAVRADFPSILVASARVLALFDGTFDVPGRSWALSGRPWEALGTLPGRTEDAPDRPSKLLGRPGVPLERPGIVLASILGAAETPKDRFWVDFGIQQASI